MMTGIRRLFAGMLLGASLLAPSAGSALEPGNDQAPWKAASHLAYPSMYSGIYSSYFWGGFEGITSSADNDYLLMTCNGRAITGVGIGFSHAVGDLDIFAYDIAGNLLGSAAGVGDAEYVDVSAVGKQAVVLRVYGYRGAIADYENRVWCS